MGDLGEPAFPPTLTVRTPSGGTHRWYNETDTVKYRLALGEAGFGLDIDVPAYVLVPGSVIKGGCYTIVDDLAVADAPDWFSLYLTEKEAIESDQTLAVDLDQPANVAWAIHHLTHDAKPSIMYQNGEYAMLMTAGALKDMGISKYRTIELLDEYYNVPKGEGGHPYCDPLWLVGDGPVEDRLDVKVENAWAYLKQNQPGVATPEADFADDPVTPEDLAALKAQWSEHSRDWRRRQRDTNKRLKESALARVTIKESDTALPPLMMRKPR
jgi:hypothetical protein